MLKNFKLLLSAGLAGSLLITACNQQMPQLPQTHVQAGVQSSNAENNFRKYDVIDIIGVGPVYHEKLYSVGIKYTDELLRAGAKRSDRKKLAALTGISEKRILRWVNHIDLMRIHGVGPRFSTWLEAVGVDSVPELANRQPESLIQRLELANNISDKKFTQRMISIKEVQKWIEKAKAATPYTEVTH